VLEEHDRIDIGEPGQAGRVRYVSEQHVSCWEMTVFRVDHQGIQYFKPLSYSSHGFIHYAGSRPNETMRALARNNNGRGLAPIFDSPFSCRVTTQVGIY